MASSLDFLIRAASDLVRSHEQRYNSVRWAMRIVNDSAATLRFTTLSRRLFDDLLLDSESRRAWISTAAADLARQIGPGDEATVAWPAVPEEVPEQSATPEIVTEWLHSPKRSMRNAG